ncbi:hypothetical protein DPMN_139332 [Dreissena polymorpha]|uniref:Uncharacterized protein n=1 Tax=Dreissena polymorpha TaxID=45954 RepID=A0A9D4JJD1_DREPO|nr:hypothetical protein DPMN_139332 [Dreissena polymorpha]
MNSLFVLILKGNSLTIRKIGQKEVFEDLKIGTPYVSNTNDKFVNDWVLSGNSFLY